MDVNQRHSVAVYGAVQATFSEETVELLRSGVAFVGASHEIRSGFNLPPTARVVVYCSKELGQPRVNLLKNAAAKMPNVQLVEAFHQSDMETKLQGVLSPVLTPPLRPDGGLQADAPSVPTTSLPSPTPPPPSNGKPELKLPPHGLRWSLTEFVFNNLDRDFRSVGGEVERLFGLAKQNGYPEATESGVGQAFRKFRQANGLSQPRPRRGKLAQAPVLVDLGYVEVPAVAEFLQDIQKMGQGLAVFVSALEKERAGNKRTIEELERRIKILEGKLENAKQAADLLAALRGQ